MKTKASKRKETSDRTTVRKPATGGRYTSGAASRFDVGPGPASARPLPKLQVSQPNDPLEREADRAADEVMRMPGPGGQWLHRQTLENEELQRQPLEESEEVLQTKTNGGAAPVSAPPNREPSGMIPTGGRALSESERAFFEPRFGADFSDVRVHEDATAAEAAKSINAKAYTIGSDVVFGAGQYTPGIIHGNRLLAHELSHVIQSQNRERTGISDGATKLARQILTSEKKTIAERFFDEIGISAIAWAHTRPEAWELYIENYWKHRQSLSREEQASLHREINRFYYILKTKGWIIYEFDLFGQKRANLRKKYEISSQQSDSRNAELWLQIAGAYVEGLRRKKIRSKIHEKLEERLREFPGKYPPSYWTEELPASDGEYNFWLSTLNEKSKGRSNWQNFIHSWNKDPHFITINNSSFSSTLDTILRGVYPASSKIPPHLRGKPFPQNQGYLPHPLEWYILKDNGGRLLLDDIKTEARSAGPLQAGGKGEHYQTYFPLFLKLGYDPLGEIPSKKNP